MGYIDKELLLKDISESVVFSVRSGVPSPELRGARKIIDRIENAPTSDVVEVVRCKDCKHYCADYCTRDIKGRTNMFYMNADDFCSYGERKDT